MASIRIKMRAILFGTHVGSHHNFSEKFAPLISESWPKFSDERNRKGMYISVAKLHNREYLQPTDLLNLELTV